MRSLHGRPGRVLRKRLTSRPVRRVRLAVEPLEDRCLLTGGFVQTNLVSDLPGVAARMDASVVNPWGLAFGPGTALWISNNNAGVSTVFDGQGNPQLAPVAIPSPGMPATATGTPTGIVFNVTTLGATPGFTVSRGGISGAALFLFATEDGTIAGWSSTVDANHAVLAVDNSANPTAATGAVYKGLAIATDSSGRTRLYAANFRSGKIDVFDTSFMAVTTLPAGAFTDPALPAGFAPFNVQQLNGKLFVTYAKQNASKHDDVAGAGNGFVDVYNLDGTGEQRLISGGVLDSPWGLAIAPASFGNLGGDLLVGNFRDGTINAFNPTTGASFGPVADSQGNTIKIDNVWALAFGSAASGTNPNTLFFTAGIGNESHGLFGKLDVSASATTNARFVTQAYQDLLHRAVDAPWLAFWSARLSAGMSRMQVSAGIVASREFRADEVTTLYGQLLHRAPDPGGLNVWVNFLANGGTQIQLEAMLAGSQEYFRLHGSSADGFINALYLDGLHRSVDPSGRTMFEQALDRGATTTQAASILFNSPESERSLVDGFFQSFLHRGADMGGLNFFVGVVHQGADPAAVIESLVGSAEYFSRV